ncbi:MAG TPA: right-handed parallel beta-helix repeat-containing protein [Usitatibacter sp.]|jgi:hypothetical protein|nr:right-handed parallel beta-helix repeat-containing protein [Usitatibacter sp.]
MLRNIARLLVLLCLVAAGGAYGQLFRAYVSASGSDANPCTLALPCRLLPAALNAVASGGEIWILDSANFNSGTVNIGKSVSVLALPGAVGSVVAVGGADAINVTGVGTKVALRDLVIASNAISPGSSGIVMSNGAALSVDRCLFSNLPHNGIDIETAAVLHVGDSLLRNIGSNDQDSAIRVAAGAKGEILDTKIDGTPGFGLLVTSGTAGVTSRASMVSSKIANTANCAAFSYTANASAFTVINVAHSAISNSVAGLCVQGGTGATATLDDVVVHGNAYGVYFVTGGPVVKSFGNNAISDNGTAVAFGTLTPVGLQ